MKGIARTYLYHVLSLWVLSDLLPTVLIIKGGLYILFTSAVVLAIFNMLLKPILKLLFLPINALSLGLFSLVINAGVFYLFLKISPQISVSPWNFPGLTIYGITISAMHFSFIITLILVSFFQSAITNFLAFLAK